VLPTRGYVTVGFPVVFTYNVATLAHIFPLAMLFLSPSFHFGYVLFLFQAARFVLCSLKKNSNIFFSIFPFPGSNFKLLPEKRYV